MEKRGQSEVLTITLLFEILAGFFLGAMLIWAVFQTGNVQNFSKEYLEADHDILITLIQNLPGNVEINYSTGAYYYEDGKFDKGAFNGVYAIEITKKDGKINEKMSEI